MKLSVIIPVYNERETIHDIIEAVSSTPYRKEIIVVDDGSTDGTDDKLWFMLQQAILSLSRMLVWNMPRGVSCFVEADLIRQSRRGIRFTFCRTRCSISGTLSETGF